MIRLNILAYDLEDLYKMHRIVLAEYSRIEPFSGRTIIISENTAEQYGLELGQSIKIEINEQPVHFRIAGIARPVGLFQEDGRNVYAVVPKEYLNALYQVRGKATLYILN